MVGIIAAGVMGIWGAVFKGYLVDDGAWMELSISSAAKWTWPIVRRRLDSSIG